MRVVYGPNHRFKYLHVTSTTTQISRQCRANICFGWLWIAIEQINCGQHHSRRADPALRSTMLYEGLLHRVKFFVAGNALDRCNLAASDLGHRHQTTIHDPAIDDHCASPTLPLATSFFRSSKQQLFSEHIEEPRHRKDLNALRLAVNCERDFALRH